MMIEVKFHPLPINGTTSTFRPSPASAEPLNWTDLREESWAHKQSQSETEPAGRKMTKKGQRRKTKAAAQHICMGVVNMKPLCNYIQFILHDQLVSQVLHNGGRRKGRRRRRSTCGVRVAPQLKALCVSVQMRLAEMCWLLRGCDIDNWGPPAMRRPVVRLFWGRAEFKCRLCLASSWMRSLLSRKKVTAAKHWKCIKVSL